MSKKSNPIALDASPSGKLRATEALAARVVSLYESGATLPETIRTLDAETGAKTINLVSPIFWRLVGESRPFEAAVVADPKKLRAAIVAARKSGERREIVAVRASVPVSAVVAAEGSKPVYTGRGTKKHLLVASA